ncbi:hypothetical protein R1sor_013986 [Riccia sorocarpa]|uniref:Uncharacterized protein n=1 Tax=Riccia sorocarpa TaxID=122646 RepID=A0ABD3H846_9MARC
MGGRSPTAVLLLLLILVAPMYITAIRIPDSFGNLEQVASMVRGDDELKAVIDRQYHAQQQHVADAPIGESRRPDEVTDNEDGNEDCDILNGFELANCQRQRFARLLDEVDDYPGGGARANEHVVFAPIPS